GYQAAPDEMFLVPAVLQKHILSDSFVVPAKRRGPQNISCPLRFIRESLEAKKGSVWRSEIFVR
ncbi:hypothetical protein, partial [Salmonella enterica]|uniref:hypothetical protein n=1 Tax=Salmonella enterica TaxID=28901 RepID=UPI001BAFD882